MKSKDECVLIRSCVNSTPEFLGAKNLCRIHVHSRTFDWMQPPNKSGASAGTGTGFVLSKLSSMDRDSIIITTAYHVVANAVVIQVNFTLVMDRYVEATFIGCNAEMDVAFLKIRDPDILRQYKANLDGLDNGSSDIKGAEVIAHGFALGKVHLQETKGIIGGRVEAPSRLQLDASVNPGNSGGPIVNKNHQVIGVVVSGLTTARGINFAAPIEETIIIGRRILSATAGPVFDDLPSLNAGFTKANSVLLQQLSPLASKKGVYCNAIHPIVAYPQTKDDALSNLKNRAKEIDRTDLKHVCAEIENKFDDRQIQTRDTWGRLLRPLVRTDALFGRILDAIRNDTLREGDIVNAITVNERTFDIDLQMGCQIPIWKSDRLHFTSVLDRLTIGETVVLTVIRNRVPQKIKITLQPNLNVFRYKYPETYAVPYLTIGGLILMSLTRNHLPFFKEYNLRPLMDRPYNQFLSIVFISHILPSSPFNKCEDVKEGDILSSINDIPIETLCDCCRIIGTQMETDALTLKTRDGSLTSATVHDILEEEVQIAKMYGETYTFEFTSKLKCKT